MIATVPTAEEDLQGFQYAQRKRKPSRKTKQAAKLENTRSRDASAPSLELLESKFHERRAMLLKSDFYKAFRELVIDLVHSGPMANVQAIKMLGIGTLTHNPSLTQLALGMQLAELLNVQPETIETSDPMYTEVDKELLGKLALKPVSVAQGLCYSKAIDAIEENTTMLIFAPHVPKSVYETILRNFWTASNISRIVLLGNDLTHYPDIYSTKKLNDESPCILAAGPLLSQAQLPTNFEHNNVFNDLSFQWFKKGTVVNDIAFEDHAIEKEHFETNRDLVAKSSP